ncbi:MAG: hypothetical protein ACYTHK_05770 [Planctomycetota bacterium]|jgi:hypothetical protein
MVEGGTLNSPEFKKWSGDYVLFLHVTTQIPDRKNDDLFGKKGGRGFPTFMFLDPKGGVLAKQPGALDIERMNKLHEGAKKRREAFVALQKEAATDAKAKDKLAVWELELMHITLDEFRKRYPDLSKLDEDLRETVNGVWADETFGKANAAAMKAMGGDRSKRAEAIKAAAAVILPVAKQGAEPTNERGRRNWYWLLGQCGMTEGNAEMLKLAIAGLEDEAEANAQLGNFIETWSKKLKELDGGKADDDDGEEHEKDEDEGHDDDKDDM